MNRPKSLAEGIRSRLRVALKPAVDPSAGAMLPADGAWTMAAGLTSAQAARILMVAVGATLLVVSGVRMQIAFTSEPAPAPPIEWEDDQGFLPMLAGEGPQEGVVRSGMVRPGWPDSYPGAAPVELQDQPAAQPDNRPVRLVIPAIGLDAPVLGAALLPAENQAGNLYQWQAPDAYAVGWHYSSALLGDRGNTVLNGHHNAFGEVFRELDELKVGDRIFAFTNEGAASYRYEVTEVLILEERSQPIDVRLRNARFIAGTSDERLTLITCWPYETNTHRLIVIARPIDRDAGGGDLELDPG